MDVTLYKNKCIMEAVCKEISISLIAIPFIPL